MNKCTNCSHSDVCALKEAYKKLIDEIFDKEEPKVKINDKDFEVEVKCKHFANFIGTVKEINVPTKFNLPDNPCTTCPSNPKFMSPNYIGDWPCQWCNRNPWKITCATTDDTNSYCNPTVASYSNTNEKLEDDYKHRYDGIKPKK